MKNLKTIIIIALLGFVVFWWFESKDDKSQIDQLTNIYNEAMVSNDSIRNANDSLEVVLYGMDIVALELDGKIDSLETQIELDKLEPCDHRLALEKQYSKELKAGLELCKEQKGIQTIQKVGLQQYAVNNEIVMNECVEVLKVEQHKQKQKKALRWIERGGWLLLIALIVI